MNNLNWLEIVHLEVGTRVVVMDAENIFPQNIVKSGATMFVDENLLSEMSGILFLKMDDDHRLFRIYGPNNPMHDASDPHNEWLKPSPLALAQ